MRLAIGAYEGERPVVLRAVVGEEAQLEVTRPHRLAQLKEQARGLCELPQVEYYCAVSNGQEEGRQEGY